MADVALTAAQIAPVDPDACEIFNGVAGSAVTAGQIVAWNTSGLTVPADADGASTLPQARGVALNGGGTGQAISILKKGLCYGFTITGLAYGAKLYISGTVGAVSDASISSLEAIGQVVPLSDSSATKVAWFDFNWVDGYA